MRTIWTIISTMALANLLAVLGFVGWLGASGRLNRERIERVRLILAPTISEETAATAAAEAEPAQAGASATEAPAGEGALLPVSAAERLKRQEVAAESDLQHLLRRESEVRAMQAVLERENDRLVRLRADLAAAQAAFAAERKRVEETDGAEQFKKALATLSGVKPKEAQSMLAELLSQGKPDEVVSYLNAMDERLRGKVMAEFNKVDPKVAADLLESLRNRGVAVAAPEASGS
jgi:hypothetical protein